MGDLNYRLDCNLPLEDLLKQLDDHPELIQQYDQLSRSISSRKAFQGYFEEKVDFPSKEGMHTIDPKSPHGVTEFSYEAIAL